MRPLGVLAAIAALPGLLSAPLTAEPWQAADQGRAFHARHAADPRPLPPPAPPPAPPLVPPPRVAALVSTPAPGKLNDSTFIARPASVQPAASQPALSPQPALPHLAAVTPSTFSLAPAQRVAAANDFGSLVRGPYDRLSPGHVGVPALSDRTAVPVQEPPSAQPGGALPPIAPDASQGRTRTVALPVSAALPVAAAPKVAPQSAPAPTTPAASLPVAAPTQELGGQQQQSFDYRPGTRTFPSDDADPAFTLDDELILQLKIKGIEATDTVVAYGTRDAVYLPLGEIARVLDLAIRVSDDGNYASGWFLDETRTLTINLREQVLTTKGGERPLLPREAQAFDGELFLRSEVFGEIFPLDLQPNLRAQALYLATREPFPFEERMRREAERAQLGARDNAPDQAKWPRQETPWLAASMPLTDVEVRAVSDSPLGTRLEGDLRIGADLAFMTAQSYISATTRDGLVASLMQMGRRDADGGLLGPLAATDFQFGDVATASMPLGLRGQAGRGAYVTNRPFQNASVFEQIDLRGILPKGYEVELYRNDILVGSIAAAANDQYEFLQVPVDYGLNIFRLVFYGPQGQRREEVRRITVGDGRLAQGQLEYDVGIVQRGENLLGVRGPNFNPIEGFGSWQAAAQLSYGLSTGITAVTSLAYFQEERGDLSIATAGLRTGLGALAVRADSALGSDGSSAYGLGLGGRLLGGAFSLSHFEYGGGFRDEIRSNSRDPLRRATELDFNGSITLAAQSIPVAARIRHTAFADGRAETDAILRNSFRLPGVVLSNTLEYSRNIAPDGTRFAQLIGNFDLATFSRSQVQLRASVGYSLQQGPELTNASAQVAYQVDDRTLVSGQAFYGFKTGEFGFGASAVREFDRFTLAVDGNYAFQQKAYSIALRIGFSFGRDPLTRSAFFAPPGQASSGAVSLRAFQDKDGNGTFGAGDVPLKDAVFSVFNTTATTDAQGLAQLTRLGNGNPVAVQIDPSSLPDILLAPVSRGVEIVPRAGRFHVMDFPVVALSEIEGTITFAGTDSARGVSGLRLLLLDKEGAIAASTRTERGGTYFIEQVKPGTFKLALDPEQAARLGICMDDGAIIAVSPDGGIYTLDAVIRQCT
ncbi:hypothetical protein C0V72_10565 [Porphyrobacter sp. TH134]|nr:hypothetical protein C0V72_10565 [Porphyrobacter sp. TH134]